MTEDVLQLALYAVERGKVHGFDEVAALVSMTKRTMVKFANNEVTVVQSWIDTETTIYVARRSRIMVINSACRDRECVDRVLRSAIERIDHVDVSEIYAPLPSPTGKPLTGLVDKRIVESPEIVIESVPKLIDTSLREGAEKVAGVLYAGYRRKGLATSSGAELAEEATFIEVYARAFYRENSGHWAWTSTRFDEEKIVDVGRRAASYAKISLPVTTIEPGRYTAILSPLVVGNLMTYLAHAASALMAMIGMSLFTKYGPGTRVGNEMVSIIDEPHDPELPNSTGFDDEGVETRRKYILRKGVFETYLHNTKTARRMGAETTGNAGWLDPHPWNIVVEPGDMSEDEMFREVRRGLFVLNNWYTRYQNMVEGQFSTVTRDTVIYIENGEPRAIVKRLRIAETFPNMLRSVVGVSKTRYDIAWWEVEVPTRAPFMLIENVQFTKPEV